MKDIQYIIINCLLIKILLILNSKNIIIYLHKKYILIFKRLIVSIVLNWKNVNKCNKTIFALLQKAK